MSIDNNLNKGLLAFINGLWLLQASLPLLDNRMPTVFLFPLSELLSLAAGTVLVVCAFSLLLRVSVAGAGVGARHSFQSDHSLSRRALKEGAGQPCFCTTVTFLVFSSLWTLGLGMHAAAVIVNNQLTPADALHPLVNDYLHRFWSHHVFEFGFFSLLLLLVWTEVNTHSLATRNVVYSNSSKHPNKQPPTSHNLCNLLEYLWSVVLGFAYAVVAKATQTVALTFAFYLAVILIYVFNLIGKVQKLPSVSASITLSTFAGVCLMVCLYIHSLFFN